MKTPRMVLNAFFCVSVLVAAPSQACPDYEVPQIIQPAPCGCACDAQFDSGLQGALDAYKRAFCKCPDLPTGFECRAAAIEDFYLTLDLLLKAFAECIDSDPVPQVNAEIESVLRLIDAFESGLI